MRACACMCMCVCLLSACVHACAHMCMCVCSLRLRRGDSSAPLRVGRALCLACSLCGDSSTKRWQKQEHPILVFLLNSF